MKVQHIASALICSLALTMPTSPVMAEGQDLNKQLSKLFNPPLLWEAPCTGCAQKAKQAAAKPANAKPAAAKSERTAQNRTSASKTLTKVAQGKPKPRTSQRSTKQPTRSGGLLGQLWPASSPQPSTAAKRKTQPARTSVTKSRKAAPSNRPPAILIPYPAGQTQPVHVAHIPSDSNPVLIPTQGDSKPAVSIAASGKHKTTHYWGAVRASIGDAQDTSPEVLQQAAVGAPKKLPQTTKSKQQNAEQDTKATASPQASGTQIEWTQAKSKPQLKPAATAPRLLTPGTASPLQKSAADSK